MTHFRDTASARLNTTLQSDGTCLCLITCMFARGDANFLLSRWMGGLKRAIAVTLGCRSRELWQPGFFDHVLRSDESYADKWNYVRENPVRAGLVRDASEWPYQGEIVVIDRV
jgi:REP element-mobilizing transposase RayT